MHFMTHRSVYITASVDNSEERHGIRAYIEPQRQRPARVRVQRIIWYSYHVGGLSRSVARLSETRSAAAFTEPLAR